MLTPLGFWFLLALLFAALLVIWIGWSQFVGAGWGPTPGASVDKMLDLAQISEGDVLYDLGCGDGRIVIRAAKKYGIRAVGFEIDPIRAWFSRVRVKSNGVRDRVEIVQRNFFDADLSPATVVSIFLTQKANQRLKAKLLSLKPGTRVVTYTWTFEGWEPERVDKELRTYLYVVGH